MVDSALGSLTDPQSFISHALFLINSSNLDNQDDATKNFITQTFYSSLAWVSLRVMGPVQHIRTKLVANSELGDNWYFLPQNYVGWVDDPQPLKYNIDDQNRVSVFLYCDKQRYVSLVALTTADINFIMAVRWHFIYEIIASNNELVGKAQLAMSNRELYLRQARTTARRANLYQCDDFWRFNA